MCSFAGNVTYPKATDLQDAAARVPDELLLVETDSPFLAPQPRARKAERARERRAHGAQGRRAARRLLRRARAARRAQRRARLRLVSGQGSIRRLREFGVRPNRELGQNFLVDDNVLRLVGDAAELVAADVVLEVGGGLGVLSEHLAPRVAPPARRRGRPLARAAAARRGRRRSTTSTLHFADAVELDMARAAAGARTRSSRTCRTASRRRSILKSIEELPDATLWVAMVQLEVGRRLAAEPGSKAYGGHERARPALVRGQGAAADLARTSSTRCRTSSRRSCASRRVAPPPAPAVSSTWCTPRSPTGARRCRRSLALAGATASGPRRALVEIGHPADARAERLSPDDFRRLAAILRA